MPNPVARITLVCKQCGIQFFRRPKELKRHRNSGDYCSIKCRGKSMRTGNKKICRECGAEFYRMGCELQRRKQSEFCSRDCYKKYRDKNAKSYRKIKETHEHRLVAESMLGRKLRPDEVVHHKDGNRRNNEPENLKVMTRFDHSRLHGKERVKNKQRTMIGQFYE